MYFILAYIFMLLIYYVSYNNIPAQYMKIKLAKTKIKELNYKLIKTN